MISTKDLIDKYLEVPHGTAVSSSEIELLAFRLQTLCENKDYFKDKLAKAHEQKTTAIVDSLKNIQQAQDLDHRNGRLTNALERSVGLITEALDQVRKDNHPMTASEIKLREAENIILRALKKEAKNA